MKLLYIEWLKLRKYRTFWLLIGLFSGLYILWNYGISSSVIKFGTGPFNFLSKSYSFPAIWDNMGYVYSWFVVFLVVFAIISISNEITFKTQRQHIIDGMSRLDFLHGKVFLILSISIASTLFYVILSYIFGFLNGGGNPLENNIKILYVFIYTLNYISFGALIALFIKRSGISIILFFAYLLLETIITNSINYKFDTVYGSLMPLQSSDELLPLPAMKTLGNMMPSDKPEISLIVCLVASLIYIVLYYFLARRKMQTSDL